jgi:hypothetical protein
VIEDSEMTGMGDDCVNVHGAFQKIQRIVDSRTITVRTIRRGSPISPGKSSPRGDHIDLTSSIDLSPRGDVTVVAAEQSGQDLTLHLDRDLPRDFQVGDFIYDAETKSHATVSNCRFLGNRARGVLAHSDALIERCSFSGQFEEAVLLCVEPHFLEGPTSDRVTIRDNEIAGVLRTGSSAAIRVDATVKAPNGKEQSVGKSVNRDILISGNNFHNIDGAAVGAHSTKGLTIANNRIGHTTGPAIVLRDVERVRIEKNTCSPPSIIEVEGPDRANVDMFGNVGLNL